MQRILPMLGPGIKLFNPISIYVKAGLYLMQGLLSDRLHARGLDPVQIVGLPGAPSCCPKPARPILLYQPMTNGFERTRADCRVGSATDYFWRAWAQTLQGFSPHCSNLTHSSGCSTKFLDRWEWMSYRLTTSPLQEPTTLLLQDCFFGVPRAAVGGVQVGSMPRRDILRDAGRRNSCSSNNAASRKRGCSLDTPCSSSQATKGVDSFILWRMEWAVLPITKFGWCVAGCNREGGGIDATKAQAPGATHPLGGVVHTRFSLQPRLTHWHASMLHWCWASMLKSTISFRADAEEFVLWAGKQQRPTADRESSFGLMQQAFGFLPSAESVLRPVVAECDIPAQPPLEPTARNPHFGPGNPPPLSPQLRTANRLVSQMMLRYVQIPFLFTKVPAAAAGALSKHKLWICCLCHAATWRRRLHCKVWPGVRSFHSRWCFGLFGASESRGLWSCPSGNGLCQRAEAEQQYCGLQLEHKEAEVQATHANWNCVWCRRRDAYWKRWARAASGGKSKVVHCWWQHFKHKNCWRWSLTGGSVRSNKTSALKLAPRRRQTEDESLSSRPSAALKRLGTSLVPFFCVAVSGSRHLVDAAVQSGRPCLGLFLCFLCSFWSSHKPLRTETPLLSWAGGSSWCISHCEFTAAADFILRQ